MTDTAEPIADDASLQAEAAMILTQLGDVADELTAAEADVEGWRAQRNALINRARRLPAHIRPTIDTVAKRAGVAHGYVSRVVAGDGRPATGHAETAARAPKRRAKGKGAKRPQRPPL